MKRFLILFALTLLVSLQSCTKDTLNGFKGNYTFKNGGYVTMEPMMTQGLPVTLALMPESGQLDILDKGDGKVLLTMNILNGSAVVMEGVINDDILTLTPYTRIVTLMQSQEDKIGAQVTISGTIKKIDKSLIFDIKYEGAAMIDGMPYMISSCKIDQIAKEN
ncbi:MAG: hypothetical protein HUJ90_08300 [Bacteroidales bacterium]|nr:hypothetical protein [Bacteroidales bacterium]